MENKKRLECFKTQLEYIQTPGFKRYAEILITKADEYFFSVPASSSGKYHPDFARKVGGLVLHTKAVVDILHTLIDEQELFGLKRFERDMLYVAAIAHDIKKQGDGSAGHTTFQHPLYASKYVLEIYKDNQKELEKMCISTDNALKLSSIVSTHMGKWYAKYDIPTPNTLGAYLLCTADVIASRKEWNQKFENEPQVIQEMLLTEVHEHKQTGNKSKKSVKKA
jgi:hypothetical protein